jgi:hypothetical protein
VALVFMTAGLVVTSIVEGRADAAVTAVRGSACGYFTNVGLFGGPQDRRGCDQTSGDSPTASPKVELPAGGSATVITANDPDGAKATYGPAAIFSGIWPDSAASAPPSGPISVSTEGTPSGGVVTSSADIVLNSPPNAASPGGIGPGPVQADEAHSTCTATETGVVGSARFVNGILYTSTDDTGAAATQEAIPESPPPNYTRSVRINHVGGHPTIVFNEQIVNPDGSLTVNGYHMYLFGPVAVGEQIVGQVTCGTTPSPLSLADTAAPVCGIAVAEPEGTGDPTPLVPARVEIGVFDTGGLASISALAITNGTAQVGKDPDSARDYLKFVPGQTGPLTVVATRENEGEPMTFSFVAADQAGNTTKVEVNVPNVDGVPTPTTQCTSPAQPGGTTTTTATGGTTTTTGSGSATTTARAAGGTATTTIRVAGGVTTTDPGEGSHGHHGRAR